ncbi:hypothetical protein [Myxococcus sp. RHSTA-1-4]|uniref:hypothetical protein n=1 Tax=Myxococcus sp. RHSTA-1-4 TaxID=2874601 RepID=UPI001CC15084|nr:hypothetical protein [Myxococcus sp. RHSTA-1-4]
MERIIAGPIPANPFVRDIIALAPDRYHFVSANFLEPEENRLRFSDASQPREPQPGPVIQAALAAPELRGLATWLRLTTYEVVRTEGGWRVTIRDVRYARMQSNGLGTAVVHLDRELRPMRVGRATEVDYHPAFLRAYTALSPRGIHDTAGASIFAA